MLHDDGIARRYARDMANDDVFRRYLDQPEGQFFDRKSGRIAPRELAVDLIAFANADGGTLVVGVENDGRITGMRGYAAKENQLVQAGSDLCEPSIRVQHERIACTNEAGEADHLLVLTVAPGERVHALTNGDAYVRIGDQSRKLSFEARLELQGAKGQTSYELLIAKNASWDDLDGELLEQYRRILGVRGSMESALVARGLAERRDQGVTINLAGALLFATIPTLWLPRAENRILRYEGTTRETGPRMNLVKNIFVGGPLPRQLPEAFRAIDSQLRGFTRLAPDGRFRTTPEYPEFAWQEAVTNAVCHRSYSLTGTPVEVFIFDDRLEVVSPGRLPGSVRVHNIRDEHFARNPRVARALVDLELVGDVGECVDRMFQEMASADLPPPEFEDRGASVRVTLRRAVAAARAEPDPEAEPSLRDIDLPAITALMLNPRQKAALQFLRSNERIVTSDLMRMFPDVRDPRVVNRYLNELVKMNLLRRVGRTFNTYFHAEGKRYWLPNER